MTKKKLDQLKWLEAQKIKDKIELDNEKQKLISSIKGLKKEDVLPTVVIPKKLTLWAKLKRVLMGL
jgi:hypothetical protein